MPTWNYQSVHAYGKSQLITESQELNRIVDEFTRIHESSLEQPWKPEYKDSLLNMIIGIEIQITELQCKYKLSQNRSDNDRNQVVKQLKKRGSIQLSEAMKNEL